MKLKKFENFDFDEEDFDFEEEESFEKFFNIHFSNFFKMMSGVSKEKIIYKNNKIVKLDYINGKGPTSKMPLSTWNNMLKTEYSKDLYNEIEGKLFDSEDIEYYIPIENVELKDKIEYTINNLNKLINTPG